LRQHQLTPYQVITKHGVLRGAAERVIGGVVEQGDQNFAVDDLHIFDLHAVAQGSGRSVGQGIIQFLDHGQVVENARTAAAGNQDHRGLPGGRDILQQVYKRVEKSQYNLEQEDTG